MRTRCPWHPGAERVETREESQVFRDRRVLSRVSSGVGPVFAVGPVGAQTMWQCRKCRSKVDDSFEVCWSCGTTPDGIEDPSFVTADDADPIPDEEVPEGTDTDDPLADFAGTPMPD